MAKCLRTPEYYWTTKLQKNYNVSSLELSPVTLSHDGIVCSQSGRTWSA